MKRGAGQDTPNSISPNQPNAPRQALQLETSEIQTRRVTRLYAVSIVTAATIARLAFAVAR
jgi:hypothetical protein